MASYNAIGGPVGVIWNPNACQVHHIRKRKIHFFLKQSTKYSHPSLLTSSHSNLCSKTQKSEVKGGL
jgi:hypothetical protein